MGVRLRLQLPLRDASWLFREIPEMLFASMLYPCDYGAIGFLKSDDTANVRLHRGSVDKAAMKYRGASATEALFWASYRGLSNQQYDGPQIPCVVV